jgi:hypothetical protein
MVLPMKVFSMTARGLEETEYFVPAVLQGILMSALLLLIFLADVGLLITCGNVLSSRSSAQTHI